MVENNRSGRVSRTLVFGMFGMAGVSISRAVPWPPHTSSPLPDLRFHHGKCAQSIEGDDGKMCPTTISPLMIWIEHDTQLVRESADQP